MKFLSRHMPWDTEYNHKNCSRNGRLPGQNFSLELPQNKASLLPTGQRNSVRVRSKDKAQFNLQHAMKTQTGCRSPRAIPFFLTSELDLGRGGQSQAPTALPLWEEIRYSFYRRFVGLRVWCGRYGKYHRHRNSIPGPSSP